MASEREARRVIKTNPSEGSTGDFTYGFYDRSHPITGDSREIQRVKQELIGLRGERIVVHVRGKRIDADTGRERRFDVKRELTYNRYTDLFGPGSVYADAIKAVRERYSEDELVTDDITIEVL